MTDPSTVKLRSRLRLMLRAERALGLQSLQATIPAVTENFSSIPAPTHPPVRSMSGIAPSRPVAPKLAAESKLPGLSQNEFPTVRFPTEPFSSAILSRDEKIAVLKVLYEKEVRDCTKCRLSQTRTNTVFGEGEPDAKIMFIGEGPGENEDIQGRPFVGQAGQLLDKMIVAMGLGRDKVFITNIVKCRPPGNREPAPDETATCTPYLLKQIEVIRPQVIVTLGRPATQFLLQSKNSMGKLRGIWHSWRGIKVMPTYHPAYVLRQYTRETREAVWNDLKLVLAEINRTLPEQV